MMEEDQGFLSNAPVVMEHDNNRAEESTAIALSNKLTQPLHIHVQNTVGECGASLGIVIGTHLLRSLSDLEL